MSAGTASAASGMGARRANALSNAQVGVLLFLASEALLFAGLVSAAIVLRAGDPRWHAGKEELVPVLGWLGTALLLGGSVAVAKALAREIGRAHV